MNVVQSSRYDDSALASGTLTPRPDVVAGDRYQSYGLETEFDWLIERDFQRIERWCRDEGLIHIPDDPDDMSLYHVSISCSPSKLSEALLRIDGFEDWMPETVLRVFLWEAASADRLLTYGYWGDPYFAALPTTRDPTRMPEHFRRPLEALAAAGFCSIGAKGSFRWLEPIEPHMEAAQVWVNGACQKEARRQTLIRIWDTMPLDLKKPFLESGAGLDVLLLAALLGRFHAGDSWTYRPGDRLPRGDDMRLDIPTAKEFGAMYRLEGLPGCPPPK